ncbi:hypothetical protein N1027_01290 [Herbiconiux sp. CPCC 205763]|uniref:Uncharacterized protein n=1 Tax=Herbiconiux aconitum TaxID=2970913 RepID=A0ABT2GPA9_9MICO|nr:hypothetical protein [Herbiconiux aconitum]MCS5716764.1 hypothetical protein [Herbiconiux aconitum]
MSKFYTPSSGRLFSRSPGKSGATFPFQCADEHASGEVVFVLVLVVDDLEHLDQDGCEDLGEDDPVISLEFHHAPSRCHVPIRGVFPRQMVEGKQWQGVQILNPPTLLHEKRSGL